MEIIPKPIQFAIAYMCAILLPAIARQSNILQFSQTNHHPILKRTTVSVTKGVGVQLLGAVKFDAALGSGNGDGLGAEHGDLSL